MKPRTKAQRQVVELSSKLPAITEKQINWAYSKLFDVYAYRTKKETTCYECGHKWKNSDLTCPKCGKKLKLRENPKKRSYTEFDYLSILTVSGNYQVNRFFYVDKFCKVGRPAKYFISEVVQHWISPNGNYEMVAKLRSNMFSYCNWDFSSKLEIRRPIARYNVYPGKVYPQKQIIPILKRNGFTGNFYNMSPLYLIIGLLTNPKVETLLKAKQIEILRSALVRSRIDDYWQSIKICIRNNHIIHDGDIWFDYLRLLESFNKDIRNPKIICVANLKEEHDKLVSKRNKIWAEEARIRDERWQEERRIEQERKREELLKRIEEEETLYRQTKGKFLDLTFTDNIINVVVLKSVQEFKEEGEILEHCVFQNEYFKDESSLILSARKDGERIETIEVSLDELRILQSRGYLNEPTEFHERIINLVRKNMHKIEERLQLVA